MEEILLTVLVFPFLGTVIGAGLVLFVPGGCRGQAALCAFSAGAMLACAVRSLLLPALELHHFSCCIGFALGMAVLRLPEQILNRRKRSGNAARLLLLAMALHNIPEGLAAGAGCAGFLSRMGVSEAEALTLALGIAVQNIPDGAVAALPLAASGASRGRAFLLGASTGLVEPLAVLVTLFFAPMLTGWLPLLMGFAAGTMLCAVIRELIPRMQDSCAAVLFFTAGFLVLTAIDILWG